jgi:soluble lytic murein transglycosylase
MLRRLGWAYLVIAMAVMGCEIPPVVVGSQNDLPVLVLPSETPVPEVTPTQYLTPTPLPAVRIKQADQLLFNGEYDKALQEYQASYNSTRDNETRAAALIGVGHVQLIQGNIEPAIQAFITIIEYYPDSYYRANAAHFLGQSYEAQGNYPLAAEAYANYLSLKPGVLDSYVQEQRGDVLIKSGDFPKALEAFEAAKASASADEIIGVEIKAATTYARMGDFDNALRRYLIIFDNTTDDYVKAEMDLLAGQAYLAKGEVEQAYVRFRDAVENYPRSYDSYSCLVALINAGVSVNELDRGLVDYFAGKYGLAIDVFKGYMDSTPNHDGTAHYYKALSHQATGEYEAALAEWDSIIQTHAADRFWIDAWEDKVFTLWYYLYQYRQAADTLLSFVNQFPTAVEAPDFLFQAGRLLERNNHLIQAAETWERMITEYPSNELSYRGLFLAGITYYRLFDLGKSQIVFQRALVLATSKADSAAANFWIGKVLLKQNDQQSAANYFERSSQADPSGYYSERAKEVLQGLPPLTLTRNYELNYDLDQDRSEAELWLRSNFILDNGVDLSGMGPLANDPRIISADALWGLGLYRQAKNKFDLVKESYKQDPVNNFRLLNHMLDLGYYQQAILISRQILDLAYLDDAATLNAPIYFNHIRFGTYFKDLVLSAAQKEALHPFLLFSVIRQESFFDRLAGSSVGARGLMQIMPATGRDIVARFGWPSDFVDDDLYRPVVSIILGANYLAKQRDYFGDLYKSLAAYNAGPGRETQEWITIAADDPDLFLEVIRYQETRDYVMQIAEFSYIYQILYSH